MRGDYLFWQKNMKKKKWLDKDKALCVIKGLFKFIILKKNGNTAPHWQP